MAENRGFGNSQGAFAENNTLIVGISADKEKRLRRMARFCSIGFPLASDPYGRVARLYDVRRRFGLGNSRITYIIDDQGVIRDAYHNEVSMSSHWRRALRTVSIAP